MLSDKGRQELHNLIASDLVGTWGEIDRQLKNVVRLLLTQRPDIVRLYFLPVVWEEIRGLDRKQSANVILALLRAGVIGEAGNPPVADWEQALFYMRTRMPRYMAMAEAWCEANPQDCLQPLKATPSRRLAALEHVVQQQVVQQQADQQHVDTGND